MSNFINKFNQFIQNNWKTELDVALNNELIKNQSAITKDPTKGPAFISQFVEKNSNLISRSSDEFNKMINDMKNTLNEEYNGYWEQTALEIYNSKLKPFTEQEVKAIQQIGRNQFNTIIRVVDNKTLYVPKIDISNIGLFEEEIQTINKLLKTRLVTNNKYNIATKVNKEQDRLDKEKAAAQDKIEMARTNNRKKFMDKTPQSVAMEESQKIQDLYNFTANVLNESNKGFNREALLAFIKKNENKVAAICENFDPKVDVPRINALVENDTSDMNIFDTSIGMMRKRTAEFDPYKNVANKASQSGKTIVSFDGKQLKEAINSMDLSKMFLIEHDMDVTDRYSNLIVECDGVTRNLVISKAHFGKFLKENADVSNHIINGSFSFNAYMKSRTMGFKNVLLREYFNKYKSKSLPVINEGTDFKIDDVHFDYDRAKVFVNYYYDADTQARETTIPIEAFSQWLESDPERYGYNEYLEKDMADHDWYNFKRFVEDLDIRDKYSIVRDYILTHRLLSESTYLKEAAQKDVVADYNLWKDVIATRTNNNYEIKRKENSSTDSIAINSVGKLLGEWLPNENKGIIYK